MEQKPGKFKIAWVDGTDSLGKPVKYQSIVPVEPVEEPKSTPEPSCYSHTWEYYEGFLIKERVCTTCGLKEITDLDNRT